MERRQYNALDIGKIIAAILVVAIHTNPLENVDSVVVKRVFEVINTLAVPFFFMCSSYFFFKDEDEQKYKARLFRFVKLYIIWSALYMPLTIYSYLNDNSSWTSRIWSLFRGFFLLGENYYSWQLWYLLALIYGLILFCVMIRKRISVNVMGIIVIALYLLSCTMEYLVANRSELSGMLLFGARVVGATFVNGRLFTAPLYIFVGYMLNKKDCLISKQILLPVLLVAGAVRVFVTNAYLDGCLRAIMAISVFVILLTMNLANNAWYKRIRQLSTVIYFAHMYIYFFLINIIDSHKGFLVFLWTLISGISLGVVILVLKGKNKFLQKIF